MTSPLKSPSPKVFERVMRRAKADIEWYWGERIAKLDLDSVSFEQGDSNVWNEERLTALHERAMDQGRLIRRARPIEAVLSSLPLEEQAVTRQRWLSFNDDYSLIWKQFVVEEENGHYLGIAVNLPAARVHLAEEQSKRNPPPRTVLEMLGDWARRSTRRRVDDLRREAIRTYARALHAYSNRVIGS